MCLVLIDRERARLLSAFLGGAFAFLLAASAAPAQTKEAFRRLQTKLENPNTLLAANLVRDEVPEVIITDVAGRIAMFDAATGEQILENRDETGRALTAPVVGDFMRDFTLDIAVGTEDGRIVIFDGGSLEILTTKNISDGVFDMPPTVLRLPAPGGGELIDVLALVDQAGRVHAAYVDGDGELQSYWQQPVVSGSKASAPMTYGHIRSRDSYDLVMPTSEGKIYLIRAGDGVSERYTISEKRRIETAVLLADFTGDGLKELVFTLDTGEVNIRRYDGAVNRLVEWKTFDSRFSPVADPVLVMPPNGSATDSLIFQAGQSNLVACNPMTGQIIRGDQKTFNLLNTQMSVLPDANGGYPSLVIGRALALMIIPTDRWFQGTPPLDYPTTDIGEQISNTILVIGTRDSESNDAGSFTHRLVGITVQSRLFGLETGTSIRLTASADRPSVSPWLAPWMTRGATPRHNPLIDTEYLVQQSQRAGRLEKAVSDVETQWRGAMDQGDWQTAMRTATWLRNYDPFNDTYQSQYRKTVFRKNMLPIIAGVVLALAVLGALGTIAFRLAFLNYLERRARGAVSKGNMEEAEGLYEKLLAKKPKSPKVVATLAMVYMSNNNTDAKTIEVYRRARENDSENQKLLHSYAQALMRSGRHDDEARHVYESALKSYPEPQVLEYHIGRCHMEGQHWEEAGKRLRAALRAGLASDEVYSALCDVYLMLNNRSAKALPVYRQQFNHRQNDSRFLEAYLDSCIDAKQADGPVETLCFTVLENNPDYVPAYTHLATIYMQRNEIGRAIEETKQALSREPSNVKGITLLAQCYLVEGRTDEEAQKAYVASLQHSPEDSELLRTLTEIYFRNQVFTSQALDIFHRSRQVNPKDLTTLKALAETARLTADHQLAIDVIENINQLGFGEPDYSKQLARSYMAMDDFGPHTEKVYREAMRLEPENSEVVAALARVLTQQEQESGDAIPVFESHLNASPGDKTIGTQLVRAYIKNNRYEEALKTAQGFLARFPEDGELQRLVALASLYDNKIDEAVKEYTQILQRNPGDQEAQFHLAMAYAQKGRTDDESARMYQRALSVKPDTVELYLALARVNLSHSDWVKAIENYQSALKTCPGNEDHIVRHLNQMLAKHPNALRVRWFLCELLVAYGHLRDAMEQLDWIYTNNPNHGQNVLGALDKILEKDQQYVPALSSRARILTATGNLQGARESLERAYKLQPNSPEIIRALSEVYEKMLGQKEDVEVRFRLGRLYYMIQEYDHAIGNFQKTAQDYRWEAESIKMLGKCFTNKGMLDLALQEFKKLVVDEETKELLYDLAQRYEGKKDLVGAKTVYRQLFAADIDYKDVKTRFEMLSGSTSDPMAFEKTNIVQQMSEEAKRRYELLDELGRGAMGIVYRARDKELEEVVALKILPDSMSNNPEAVRRFKIEARNARKLSHPNIVRIHDIGEEMGRKYISMEFVDGSDLKRKVKSGGPMTAEEVFHYAIQIADALGYAHRLGIVHRDIKPANIMLTSDDQIKVTDFGIAKMLDSAAMGGEGTMVGAVIGTPLYMSPEQVQGVPVDNRADLYSYGIMLYEFVAGKPPFTQGDLAYQHMHAEPQRPEGCSDGMWGIIQKCLAKSKEERWEKAEDIVEALKDLRKQTA